jgi:lambda repressor-like predicted transcriptional regulator
MKHLTPDQKQYILKRHREGGTLRGIAREIGRSDITVRRTLEASGVDLGPPKTSNKRASPETEALVLRLYDEGRSWQEINEQAGVTSVTLGKILQRNGREYDRKGQSAEAKTDVIAALTEAGHSAREIGRMLGHSKSTICNIIERSNTEPVQRWRGCERPDFFEQIDTPEKAYWLGFISADGCIVATAALPEGSHLNLKLAIRDKGHLVKLKEALGVYVAVRSGLHNGFGKIMGYAELNVRSGRITESLITLGITPRKSATLEPWDGPADLMPHYWRGLFDGDGSMAIKGPGLYTAFLCGSEACVRGFRAWAHEICGTNATPYFRDGCWYVSIGGRYQVPKLVRALYENAPVSLDRKQAIADAILANEQPRKKPGPASRFATGEEREANSRKVHREAQRRYMERKREQDG